MSDTSENDSKLKERREKQKNINRERYNNDPEYKAKIREKQNVSYRERYNTDPEYKEKIREKQNKINSDRYNTDSEYKGFFYINIKTEN